ncbi:MAG: NUDIX domain-containing protein [Myxococcota bacterium]
MSPSASSVRVVAGAWIRGRTVLAAQHGPDRPHANEWEFPGGKVEPGETDAEALRRELIEELGASIEVREPALARHTFQAGPRTIDLWLYEVWGSATPTPLEHAALTWIDIPHGDVLTWSRADAHLWRSVRARLLE